MKIVEAPKPRAIDILAYNTHHEFTRRVPTFRTKKQEERDSKIIASIVKAYEEENGERVLEIFFSKAKLLTDPIYWEVLRTVWVACGSTELAPKFRPYFLANRRAKSWFMTLEDAEYLNALSFPITLYRAYDEEPDAGISWTSDKEWCENYAARKERKIKSAVFERGDIYAYISRRGENEFIILKSQSNEDNTQQMDTL